MRRPTRGLLIAPLVCASLGALALQAASKQTVGHVSGQPQSPAVRAGDFIYVSGALATDERGTVCLGGPSHRVAVEDAYGTVFTGDLPARPMVGTGLIVSEGLVEIMLTAVK